MLYADITKMLAIVWNARSRKDLIKQIVFDLEYTHLWKDGQNCHRIHSSDQTSSLTSEKMARTATGSTAEIRLANSNI